MRRHTRNVNQTQVKLTNSNRSTPLSEYKKLNRHFFLDWGRCWFWADTPIRKKRERIRRIVLSLVAFTKNNRIAFLFNSSKQKLCNCYMHVENRSRQDSDKLRELSAEHALLRSYQHEGKQKTPPCAISRRPRTPRPEQLLQKRHQPFSWWCWWQARTQSGSQCLPRSQFHLHLTYEQLFTKV